MALALLLCAVPTAQAIRCPTSRPVADSQPQRVILETPSQGQDTCYDLGALYGRGRIGLFVGNNPINYVDPQGLFFDWFFNNSRQRQNPHEGAVTWHEFVEHARGMTLDELANEMGDGSEKSVSRGGPSLRYVKDPCSKDVIDMRHFLVVGRIGELFGMLIELNQLIHDQESAFDAQDFLSNTLGADFYSHRDQRQSAADQLQNWFQKRTKWYNNVQGIQPTPGTGDSGMSW